MTIPEQKNSQPRIMQTFSNRLTKRNAGKKNPK